MIWRLVQSMFFLLAGVMANQVYGLELTGSLEGISIAQREDSLRWKIKEKEDSPAVIHEFCFEDVKMVQWGVKSQVTMDHCYSLKCIADYANAYNKARDSAYDISLGVGYHFYTCDCTLRITPYAGFEINRQRFKSCLEQYSAIRADLPDPLPEPNYFANLHTRYRAHWYAPWIGVDLDYMFSCDWKAYGSFAYYFTRIRGKGHTSFGSLAADGFAARDVFSQHGYGHGIGLGLGLQYNLAENWVLDVSGWFEDRKVYSGKQHGKHWFETEAEAGPDDIAQVAEQGHAIAKSVSDISGSSEADEEDDGSTPIRNHLKHVEWRSFRVEVALCFQF